MINGIATCFLYINLTSFYSQFSDKIVSYIIKGLNMLYVKQFNIYAKKG